MVLAGLLLWPFLNLNHTFFFEEKFDVIAFYEVYAWLLGSSLILSLAVFLSTSRSFLIKFNFFFGFFWLIFFSYPIVISIVQFAGGWWNPYYLIAWSAGFVLAMAGFWLIGRRIDILPVISALTSAIILMAGIQLFLDTQDAERAALMENIAESTKVSQNKIDPNTDKLVSEYSEYRVTDRRNIYFLLPDGYPRTDVLAMANIMDNGAFEKRLEEFGFVVATKSTANTAFTEKTVSSTFSMRTLFNSTTNEFIPRRKDALFFHAQYGGWSAVHQLLAQSGYKIFYAGINEKGKVLKCDGKCLPLALSKSRNERETRIGILKMTPLYGVLDQWFNSAKADLLHHAWRQKFDLTSEQLKSLNAQSPFFVYLHIMTTHKPLLFDENCDYIKSPNNTQSMPRMFGKGIFEPFLAGAVKCVNKTFEAQVKRILKVDPEAVIILQSDHGMRRKEPNILPTKYASLNSFGNFTALRLPQRCRRTIPNDLKNVDTFPVILSCLGNMAILGEAARKAY